MKKTLLLLTFALASTFAAKAQEAKSMEPIIKLGLELVHQIEGEYPSVVAVKADFDFALDDNYTYVDLVAGLDYIIAAVGDNRVQDISLIVYQKVNGKWVLVKEDKEKTNYAILELKPEHTGQYAFDVHVNSFEKDDKVGHVGLMVFAQKNKKK